MSTLNAKKQSKSQHYALVAGKVIFEHNGAVNSLELNATIITDEPAINAAAVGKAQQGLQMTLFQRLGEEAANVEVKDVFILSISRLGQMTETKWLEGMDGLRGQVAGNA